MKVGNKDTLLFGNGINIEFGGSENTNKSIILRSIKSVSRPDYPKHIFIDEPQLIIEFLGYLFPELADFLNHKYDDYAITNDEKSSLLDFIRRYENRKSITIADIGFEDYFLMYDLFTRKQNITNPDRYHIREALKCFFLYSIYNDGKVNEIYHEYPEELLRFLEGFDILFTTNYDQNVEMFTGKKVYYLHGSFNIKNDVYNPDSLRNHMKDAPLKNIQVDENFYFLYSNALISYAGNSKLFSIRMNLNANEGVEKLTRAYQQNQTVKDDVDSWENDKNALVARMNESVGLKQENPGLTFPETYPIKEFENIAGELTILGLSPNNDIHIFEMVDNNEKISNITFYYYDTSEKDDVRNLIKKHSLSFLSVKELWERMVD